MSLVDRSPRSWSRTRTRPLLTRRPERRSGDKRSVETRSECACSESLAVARVIESPFFQILPSVSEGDAEAARRASSRTLLFRKRANKDEHGMHIVTSRPQGSAIRTAVIPPQRSHFSMRLLRLIVLTCPSPAAAGHSCRNAMLCGSANAVMRASIFFPTALQRRGGASASMVCGDHDSARPLLGTGLKGPRQYACIRSPRFKYSGAPSEPLIFCK